MNDYKRLTERDEYGNADIIGLSTEKLFGELYFDEINLLTKALNKLAFLETKIENGTLKEVVRCKDCVYFQPEYVEMENKERRPYTKEEIKNGKFVSLEKGINCGSRCERFSYWEKNSYPVWFNENDFCSYGKPKPKHS